MYSMFPFKRTVFFTSVSLHKNTVRLIGNIEYFQLLVQSGYVLTHLLQSGM